jgi:hypothetical protein
MTDERTYSQDAVRDVAARILEVHAQVTQALQGGERALRDFASDEKQHPAARRAAAEWLARAPAAPWGMGVWIATDLAFSKFTSGISSSDARDGPRGFLPVAFFMAFPLMRTAAIIHVMLFAASAR